MLVWLEEFKMPDPVECGAERIMKKLANSLMRHRLSFCKLGVRTTSICLGIMVSPAVARHTALAQSAADGEKASAARADGQREVS
jgi:hypothetical protein